MYRFSTTQHTDYDNNKNNCLRWKDSYGPLMEADTSWTTNPQQFHFAACSGALLVNIVKDPQGDNPRQMDLVGKPQLLTYHAGGNNCQFGSVVKGRVYQPSGSFGPAYPDPAGKCFQTLNDSNRIGRKFWIKSFRSCPFRKDFSRPSEIQRSLLTHAYRRWARLFPIYECSLHRKFLWFFPGPEMVYIGGILPVRDRHGRWKAAAV